MHFIRIEPTPSTIVMYLLDWNCNRHTCCSGVFHNVQIYIWFCLWEERHLDCKWEVDECFVIAEVVINGQCWIFGTWAIILRKVEVTYIDKFRCKMKLNYISNHLWFMNCNTIQLVLPYPLDFKENMSSRALNKSVFWGLPRWNALNKVSICISVAFKSSMKC